MRKVLSFLFKKFPLAFIGMCGEVVAIIGSVCALFIATIGCYGLGSVIVKLCGLPLKSNSFLHVVMSGILGTLITVIVTLATLAFVSVSLSFLIKLYKRTVSED